MIELIQRFQRNLQATQQRGLVILGGETKWCYQQLKHLIKQHNGDWIAVESNLQSPLKVTAVAQAKQVLGQSYLHGLFDLQQGFDVIGLAMLAGTLKGGSLFVLIAPLWQDWPTQRDNTSMQWDATPVAKAAPNFIHVVQRVLTTNPIWLGWWQDGKTERPQITTLPVVLPPRHADSLTDEQHAIYEKMCTTAQGFWVLTAARGRGKSLLAGRVAQFFQQKGACWVTAPQRRSALELLSQTTPELPFFAPDDLFVELERHLKTGQEMPWLIVEEAAVLPLPFLLKLSQYCDKILFVTTLQGYEGSGSGFLLKFLNLLPQAQLFILNKPIRWSENDPLERLLNRILLLQDDVMTAVSSNPVISSATDLSLQQLTQSQLADSAVDLASFYQLLTTTHYRTSPLDLRRLLDAPYAHLTVIYDQQRDIVAGCWSLYEGEIASNLQQAIILGLRRPKGNLVPQTLLAHGQLTGGGLKSIRITRLAVKPTYRRNRLATQLIQDLIHQATAQRQDYVSASFGYTDELAQFWQQCGFQLIHIGTQRETKSGCYSSVFIYPISDAAQKLVNQGQQQLEQDWYWLKKIIAQPLPLHAISAQNDLVARDWLYLMAFALGKRAIHSTYPNLMRLVTVYPALERAKITELCGHYSKKQALHFGRTHAINQLRHQVAEQLMKRDPLQFRATKQQLFGQDS